MDSARARGGAEQDLAVAGIALPALLGIGYGIVSLVQHGPDVEHYVRTYVALAGGVLSIAAAIIAFGRSKLSGPPALAGLIPWAYSLYLIFFLGAYGAFLGIRAGAVLPALGSLIWVLLGWHMLTKVSAAVSRSQAN